MPPSLGGLVHIVGISGSLRSGSLNAALLRAAVERLPSGVTFEPLGYASVPVFVDEGPLPDAVGAARASVAAADALLIATPEYNHSVPGPLKNLIDWLSRPAYQAAITGRPCGVLSASPGAVGGARAQQHLKVILLAAGAPVFPGAELVVGQAVGKLPDAAEGGRTLADPGTSTFLTEWLGRFVAWAAR